MKKEYPKAGDCTKCAKCILGANERACWTYANEPLPDAVFVPKTYREADMY